MGLFPMECPKCGIWYNSFLDDEEKACPHKLTRKGLDRKLKMEFHQEFETLNPTEYKIARDFDHYGNFYLQEIAFSFHREDDENGKLTWLEGNEKLLEPLPLPLPKGFSMLAGLVKVAEEWRVAHGLPQLVDYRKTWDYLRSDAKRRADIESCKWEPGPPTRQWGSNLPLKKPNE